MANKYKIVLVDYRYNGKGDKVINRWYSSKTAHEKAAKLVKEEGYITYRVIGHPDNVYKEYK